MEGKVLLPTACQNNQPVSMMQNTRNIRWNIVGITNTVATTPGMLAPLLADTTTPNKTQEEWRNVFYVCGGVCILGILVFGTQARGELQPWAVEQATVDVGEGQDVPGGLTNDVVVNAGLEQNTTFMSTHL